MLRVGSLFDGSGGFLLAGQLAGMHPVWASEIEKYPVAVTSERFPSLQHLGDIRQIDGCKVDPVDVITFGSPCQDQSVAGRRAGLGGGQSGLFYEAIRVIREMREATNGKKPRYAVFENVVGAFSSNGGNDFKCVQEAFCALGGHTIPLPEPDKKRTGRLDWKHAGAIVGSGFSIAWRTFDAQYWGVPQRRRRIYLVADFGGECAGEILFEPQGVRRDSAQSRAPGKEAAADASKRVGRSSECLTQWDMQTARIYDAVGSGPALSANSGGLNRRAIPVEPDVFPSLTNGNGHMSVCDGIPNCVVMPKCDQCSTVYGVVSKGNGEAFIAKDRHTALSVGGGQAGQGYPCVMIADEDAAAFDAQNTRAASEKDDSTNHQSPVCYRFRGYGDYVQDYVASTQRAAHDKMTADMVVSPGPKYIVRRLTPVECARQQGFPGWWGDIPNKKLQSDCAQYRMWGNGIALPCAAFVMRSIARHNSQPVP